MTLTYAIVGISGLVLIGIIASIPFRTKKALNNAGKLLHPLTNGVPIKVVGLFILSALILVVIPMRNFAVYIQVIFVLVSLISARMAAQEAAGLGHAGIYENVIISSMAVLPFDDILSIPTLSYEDDPETAGVDKTTIELIRKSNAATVLLTFENEEKRQEALKTILQVRPELKVENEE